MGFTSGYDYGRLYKAIKPYVSFKVSKGKLSKYERAKVLRYHRTIYGYKAKDGTIVAGLINNGQNTFRRINRTKARKVEIALRQRTSGLGQLKGAFAPKGARLRFKRESVTFTEWHGQFKVKHHIFDVNEWREAYALTGVDFTEWIRGKVESIKPEHPQSRFMIKNGENTISSLGLMNQAAAVAEVAAVSNAYGGGTVADEPADELETRKDFPSRWLVGVLEYIPLRKRGKNFAGKVADYIEIKKKRQIKKKQQMRNMVKRQRARK